MYVNYSAPSVSSSIYYLQENKFGNNPKYSENQKCLQNEYIHLLAIIVSARGGGGGSEKQTEVDPDQTAPEEQSDQDLLCLFRCLRDDYHISQIPR